MTETLTQLRVPGSFDAKVKETEPEVLRGLTLETVQVNIGLRCNLACHHCHVESGPKRAEEMDWPTMQLVLDVAKRVKAKTVDVTGGAPEMHPHFRQFVATARAQGHEVIVRTNLTILLEPGYEQFPQFFKDLGVHLIASLPCYLENNVDKQRGRGVYKESIEVIQRLNAIGYGVEPTLPLDLVFNPGGAGLPPPQEALEGDYRRELGRQFDIKFTRLLTITNMPIGRFQHDLERQGKGQLYRDRLLAAYNPATLPGLMCRHQIHVGYDGTLYDCDFNFALHMPVERGTTRHIRDFDPVKFLARRIVTADHCFACTAGAGSSCGGAVV